MKSKDFTLSVDAADAIRAQLPWIRSLFSEVEIKFEDSSTSARTKIEWVSLLGQTEISLDKAKNYITSLTNPSAKAILQVPESFKKELLVENSKLLKSFERESAAVIVVESNSSKISVQGVDELTVVLAKSLLDEGIQKHSIAELCQDVKLFAIKLGFDDGDIMAAVEKCKTNGKTVNENTLLQELVDNCPQKLKVLTSDLIQENEKVDAEIARTIAEVTTAQTTTSSSSNSVSENLRDIIIDGSNVAMNHGHKEVFSCKGIDIVVNWFKQCGHENIVVFVPQWRQEAAKPDSPIIDQYILTKLQKEKILTFTPSRKINGRRVVCYDDRYIVKHAYSTDGVIVSNDNFRDLQKETPEWKSFLEQRLLMFSFVNDRFMPPDDPLGRCGPTLSEFLKKGSLKNRPCPYKNKCTYGSKCRYSHPEKDNTNTSQAYYSTPIPSISSHQTRNHSTNLQPYSSNIRSAPYTSCAVEHKLFEGNSTIPQEVIARGCGSIPPDYERNGGINQQERDWQQQRAYQQQQQQAYYQHARQQQQQQHHQQQIPSQYYLQTSYSLPVQQTQSWDNSYTSTQKPSYSSVPQQMYASPSQQQHHANGYTMLPTAQPVRTHMTYSPAPSSSELSIMPGYIDPRMINQYYRRDTGQIHAQYVQPIPLSVETPLVQETRLSGEYLLRSCPTSKQDLPTRSKRLIDMFPDRHHIVYKVLNEHPNELNLDILATYILAD